MDQPKTGQGAPIHLIVDATDVARAIFWARQTIPVAGHKGAIALTLARRGANVACVGLSHHQWYLV